MDEKKLYVKKILIKTLIFEYKENESRKSHHFMKRPINSQIVLIKTLQITKGKKRFFSFFFISYPK